MTARPLRTPAFDWDEARRLRAEGMTIQAISDRLSVTWNAVWRVLDDDRLARSRSSLQARNVLNNPRHHTLCECGRAKRWHNHKCVLCAADARTISVRDDSLQCASCREWKDDEEFSPASLPYRRGRHKTCRACNAAAKREARRRAA